VPHAPQNLFSVGFSVAHFEQRISAIPLRDSYGPLMLDHGARKQDHHRRCSKSSSRARHFRARTRCYGCLLGGLAQLCSKTCSSVIAHLSVEASTMKEDQTLGTLVVMLLILTCEFWYISHL